MNFYLSVINPLSAGTTGSALKCEVQLSEKIETEIHCIDTAINKLEILKINPFMAIRPLFILIYDNFP